MQILKLKNCSCVLFFQDYANTDRVTVKGNATLRLEADRASIKMANETREVSIVSGLSVYTGL